MHFFLYSRAIKKRHSAQQSHLNPQRNATGSNNNSVAANSEESYREERRCAAVLFTIVILFFVSHAPRIALNFYEFFTIEGLKEPCYHIPLWAMILTCVSLLFMTINSSVNFFVYCFANSLFRQEFLHRWTNFKAKLGIRRGSSASPNNSQENQIQLQVVNILFGFCCRSGFPGLFFDEMNHKNFELSVRSERVRIYNNILVDLKRFFGNFFNDF